MQYTQLITLDILQMAALQVVEAKQGDSGRFINITITAAGKKVTPEEGTTAAFNCLKPDGKSVLNLAKINDDGTVTIELTEQVLAVSGYVEADISLLKDEVVISTASFRVHVEKKPISADTVTSSNEFLLMNQATESAMAFEQHLHLVGNPHGVTPQQIGAATLLQVYPVGSIYMSLSATDPGTLFGGTWERITDVFLFAANSANGYAAGSTGGEAAHTLTVEEMPSHNHNIRTSNSGVLDRTVNTVVPDSAWSSQFGGDHTEAAGGGQAHNNMPPYLAVYMWQRTA